MNIPDNYDQFVEYEAVQEARQKRYEEEEKKPIPECEWCGESLWKQDTGVCIEGSWYCDHCLEIVFRKPIEL